MPNHYLNGFSLLEVMTVLLVISVLIMGVYPTYEQYVRRAKVSEGFHLAQVAKVAVQRYVIQHGQLPEQVNNRQLNLGSPLQLGGRQVKSISVGMGGQITITYFPPLGYMKLKPTWTGHQLRWQCLPGTLNMDDLPKGCHINHAA